MELIRILWDIIDLGGPVMIPIGMLSAWMWILIVLKSDWIRRVHRRPMPIKEALHYLESYDARRENRLNKCNGLAKPDESLPPVTCPGSGALHYFMDHHFRGRSHLSGEPDQLFFEVAIRRQTQHLYRHIHTIMVLAAAAPLLGLLGTVTGMVETFRVIGLYGMGNAQAMASGIKAALITTQAGLLVAIPGLLIGQALSKKVKGIHREILIFHRAVTQWLEKESRSCTE